MSTLRAIWIKAKRRLPLSATPEAELVAGRGIAGNANQGGKRQVTIIEEEAWQRVMQQVGAALDPSTRRANLMVAGIRLERTIGRVLRIGACRLLIHGETDPCERMEEALPGLRAALEPNWCGGAFGEVLTGGRIAVGDEVAWEAPA